MRCHTLAALERGQLCEWRAMLVVRESACLEVDDRRALDAELCADPAGLDGLGDARLVAAAKQIAYRLDPHAVVERAAKAESERTVTIRPAPDTMTYLTVLLPVAQGVSVYAALRRAADTSADGRARGQVMADTLVERVTERSAATPMPIAVLRRPDPAPRPRAAGCRRRADQRGQRPRYVRTLQLRQRGTRVDVATVEDESGRHAAEFSTPTGRRYRSVAPTLPRAPTVSVSAVERGITIALGQLHVA